jgi:hypothetical protein
MIEKVRHEKRDRNGWIMDTHLFNKPNRAAQTRLPRTGTSCDHDDL